MRSLLIHFAALVMLGFVGAAVAQSAEDEAKLCGIDPAHSTFRTTHFSGGDVTVTVPIDADGNPAAALDAGPFAAKVVASGKREKSIFPKQEFDPGVAAIPVSVRVSCYADGRRIVVTVPMKDAEPYTPAITKMFGNPLPPPADEKKNSTMVSVGAKSVGIDGYQHIYVYARKIQPVSDWVLVRDELVCEKGDTCWSS
ncbi:hypothetical protein ELE36_18410 [Pseudolysobacter antarcticus]|uniref:Uncharacterized protein n=1 Tax=Pseudolysobacter antarcticus TaxID=2511995 RepID=A0A411HNW2_9GAMM|nr:hypothetical protein [Pseudolysobacter antarcticus]QBB72177.1 hypothetical protein ELE36_18410 [Pseudolysobacter antarcticus]